MLDPDEEQPGIPLFPISHGLSRAPVKRVPLRPLPQPCQVKQSAGHRYQWSAGDLQRELRGVRTAGHRFTLASRR